MKRTISQAYLFSIILFFVIIFPFQYAQAKQFTIVIDAGHGGKDAGAIGKFSKEKDLNLAVSLLFGSMIEKNNPDVKIVYTRKSDIFPTLQERADIVNKHNADVFFCIHTNANKNKSARGTETYTLNVSGARNKGNLEVAMRENSVMMLEDDYKSRYQGFDPGSIDSYIMFDFMQNKYIDKSVQLASTIQNQFTRIGRFNRGVMQADFWVLYKSACPSVLIEMGFISNRDEEIYLNSDEGQSQIATCIYKAFLEYKKDYDKKSGKKTISSNKDEIDRDEQQPEKEKYTESTNAITQSSVDTTNKTSDRANLATAKQQATNKDNTKETIEKNKTIYKVQIIASKVKLSKKSSELKGLEDVDYYYDNGLYKYTYGNCSTQKEALELRKKIAKKFPNGFVVAFKNDKRIEIK